MSVYTLPFLIITNKIAKLYYVRILEFIQIECIKLYRKKQYCNHTVTNFIIKKYCFINQESHTVP